MGRNANSTSKRGALALSIVALLVTVSVPVHSAPCLGVSILPPYAHVDPNCMSPYEMTGSTSPLDASAVADGFDARVSWGFTEDPAAPVQGYVIYKGHTPETMSFLAWTDARSSNYEDSGALLDAGQTWYQVRAVYQAGGHVDSLPVVLELEVGT